MKTLTQIKTPVLTGIAMFGLGLVSAFAQPIYPTSGTYTPGTTADGLGQVDLVVPGRTDDANAIGIPQNSDIDMGEVPGNSATVNFTSLGFGGNIILNFSQPIGQGEGIDVEVFETSYNTPNCGTWPEYADAYISQDGCNWVKVVTNACQNFGFDLPANMPWALYLQIVDVSPNGSFAPNADGFDVDGARANYVSAIVPNAPGSPIFATGFENFIQGTMKGSSNLPALNRRDASKATLMPQMSDATATPNFVSLGFDKTSTAVIEEGQITLKFDYSVFDITGPDLFVYETTFNESAGRSCDNYPEIAEFYGSNDGVTFTLLAADPSSMEPASLPAGRLCRDGSLDLGNMPLDGGVRTIRYLKIIDKSTRSSSRFPGAADGYDVDGVIAYPCQPLTNGGKFAEMGQNNIPDEDGSAFFLGLYPNPANETVTLNIETASVDQNYIINIFDMTGRKVQSETLNAASNSVINHNMNLQGLTAGVYTISVEANGFKAVERLLKN